MIRTKPGWKSLKGIENWLPELQTLLSEAKDAAQKPKLEPRLAVSEYLSGFIQESWPQTPDMDRLDDLALQAATDLMKTTLDDRLAGIISRSAEYVRVEKSLNTAAARGESAAEAIRLESIQNLISATTQTINSANALVAALDSSKASEKKIAGLVEAAVDAVTKLRSEVAKLI